MLDEAYSKVICTSSDAYLKGSPEAYLKVIYTPSEACLKVIYTSYEACLKVIYAS